MKNKLSTILLVEDESEVRMELKKFLQRYCDNVITAKNGEEGLALFNIHKPEIVISDIKMPKMNGIDMAKKIKKNYLDQIIIFTTAHSDSTYFLEAIEMQVDGYILKPVDLTLLKKKINDIHKNIEAQRQKSLYENILDDIAQMQDNMLAVYDINRVPVFFNKRLLDFLGYKNIESFVEEYKLLSNKFETVDECYYPKSNRNIFWIDEVRNIEPEKRIISMKNKDNKKVKFFLVSLSEQTQSKNIIISFSEITTIVTKKRQYENDAYTDELTQINNRAKFNIIFNQVLEKSQNNKSSLSIILIDIDNFKDVNDSHGHSVGDNVLKKFTTLISNNIRITDEFSRWGGEEFVLLLEDTKIKETHTIAENLRVLIEKHDFGIHKQLTCSFGVSSRVDNDTSESLFERVDRALYKAKNSGRNRVISE